MLFLGVIKYKDGCGPFKRALWVALASTCLNLCAGFSSKSTGTNHQVVLSFVIERAFHSALNHSLRFIVPQSTVLDFAHGLWTEEKILVSFVVLCHPLYQLIQTVHLYPFAQVLYRKKKKGNFSLSK